MIPVFSIVCLEASPFPQVICLVCSMFPNGTCIFPFLTNVTLYGDNTSQLSIVNISQVSCFQLVVRGGRVSCLVVVMLCEAVCQVEKTKTVSLKFTMALLLLIVLQISI